MFNFVVFLKIYLCAYDKISLVSILTFFFFFAKIYNTKLVLEESFG